MACVIFLLSWLWGHPHFCVRSLVLQLRTLATHRFICILFAQGLQYSLHITHAVLNLFQVGVRPSTFMDKYFTSKWREVSWNLSRWATIGRHIEDTWKKLLLREGCMGIYIRCAACKIGTLVRFRWVSRQHRKDVSIHDLEVSGSRGLLAGA